MSSNSSGKTVTLGDVASVEIEHKRDGPVEEAQRLNTPVSQAGDPEDILAAVAEHSTDEVRATTEDGQPLNYGVNPRKDSRGRAAVFQSDYDWDRSTEVGPNRRFGETLVAQERRLGEEREMEFLSQRARAAAEADLDRGQSSRAQNAADSPWQKSRDVQRLFEEPQRERDTGDPEAGDPRAGMAQETLAAVNQAAHEVAAKVDDTTVNRPEMSKLLAEMVDAGREVESAAADLKAALTSAVGAARADTSGADGDAEYSRPDGAWPTPPAVQEQYRPDEVGVDVEGDAVDPRATLDQATLAAVNRAGAKLAEYFGDEVIRGRAAFTKQVAGMVANGKDVLSAFEQIKDTMISFEGVKRAGTDVSTWDYQVTVEGRVTFLYEHPAESQFQAGWIETADGTRLKVTYWQKSKKSFLKPRLREGDKLRLEKVKVNEYKGKPSLAITGDTVIHRLEWGDGEAPCHATSSGKPQHPPWSIKSKNHAWVSRRDTGPDIDWPDSMTGKLLDEAGIDRAGHHAGRGGFKCLICGDVQETREAARTHHETEHR